MSGWRQFAAQVLASEEGGDKRDNETKTPSAQGFVPFAPFVPQVISDPTRLLREWHAGLAPLDIDRGPAALNPARWRQLVSDAHWLYEGFASAAARNGWSASDLFGVDPHMPAWGGIADRLQGARPLVMTAERADWRWPRTGAPDTYCRGFQPNLMPLWVVYQKQSGSEG